MFASTSFSGRQLINGGGIGIAPRSLGKPAASYPGAIATDAHLAIAVDRQQTTLAVPVSTTDTIMIVTNAALIVVNSLLSIDNEIVQVTGVSGFQVNITRGFDGTTPAIHLAGAVVSGFVDAWHHNTLVAEVEAIEQTLGTNLSRIPAVPFLVSSNFVFPPQSPGGSLGVGNNAITLSPVPAGVNGSDQAHYLYISGGTGAAEPVLITGGSAVSGAPSGTLIVNCANAHSGAWTIQTATAGIQEAIAALPTGGYGGGEIYIPQGTWNIYATITVRLKYGVRLTGTNKTSACLHWKGGTTQDVIFFDGTNSPGGQGGGHAIEYLQIEGESVNGSSNYALHCDNQAGFLATDIAISGLANGIHITSSGNDTQNAYRNLAINVAAVGGGNGIRIENANDPFFFNVRVGGDNTNNTDGWHIVNVGGMTVQASSTIYCGNGFVIAPGSGQSVAWLFLTDCTFDTSQSQNLLINPSGTGTVYGVHFVNCWTSNSQGGCGVMLGPSGTIDGVEFIGHRAVVNRQHGYIVYGGVNLSFTDSIAVGNGAASPGSYQGLYIEPGVSRFRVIGGLYAQGYGNPAVQGYGIVVSGGASDYYLIQGATVTPNATGGIVDGGTGTNARVIDNIGYNPIGQSTLTVGASPFTYRAGHSREAIYIRGGTVSNIQVGATTVATASPAQLFLAPNESITVTYSVAPTIVKDAQ